ncbi:MAG TPA: glycosyltransferase family 1 protein [Rikenellaceae bacterium]|nr:glycosyltransferase family 1 protein [Rikenellaceae bacterium]
MRILYDHQIFTLQNYGGISRYFCELMGRLSQDPDIELTLALCKSRNENLRNLHLTNRARQNNNIPLCDAQESPTIQKIMHLGLPVARKIARIGFPIIRKVAPIDVLNNLRSNQRESVRFLKKQEFDLFHPTYYDPYFTKYLMNKPYVLTVHDMIHELYPDFFSPYDRTKEGKKQLIESANSIIAVSENTKKDIIKLFDVDPDLIHVVYHGNPFESEIKSPIDSSVNSSFLKKPYLLYVGNRKGYKNFIFFIKTMAKLLKKYENLHIYCAGGGPFDLNEMKMLRKLDLSSKVHYIKTNNYIMKQLYANAQAFVFPSLYEGFGLPILEAFSCGCPAILSNSSSLPEIGADAACYFDPNDPESLARRVEEVLSDNNYRNQCIIKGFERLKFFSWEKTAQETKTVYGNLACHLM